jgi:hypothetical protein
MKQRGEALPTDKPLTRKETIMTQYRRKPNRVHVPYEDHLWPVIMWVVILVGLAVLMT